MIKSYLLLTCIIVQISYINSQCTSSEINDIVNAHNSFRKDAGVNFGPKPISPLKPVKWSNTIALKMQSFVSTCKYNTVPDGSFSNYGYASFRIGGNFNPFRSLNKTYYHDAPLYNWDTKSCIENSCCYSYPTFMWNDTTEIGCGKSTCGQYTWLLCGYNPPGGLVGVNPYLASQIVQGRRGRYPTPQPSWSPEPTSMSDSTDSQNPTQINQPSGNINDMGLLSLVNGLMDWRSRNGIVTTIKDQGQCGDCYSFATAGTLESGYLIGKINQTQDSTDIDLSEQYFLDCTYNRDGCNGGNVGDILQKFQSTGAKFESDYPYKARYQGCPSTKTNTIKWTGFKTIQPNKQSFLNELKYGPIAVSMYADSGFQHYRNGIYKCQQNSSPNHGYNESEDYWIIKNSWNTWWGMSGYGFLSSSSCSIYQYQGYRPLF